MSRLLIHASRPPYRWPVDTQYRSTREGSASFFALPAACLLVIISLQQVESSHLLCVVRQRCIAHTRFPRLTDPRAVTYPVLSFAFQLLHITQNEPFTRAVTGLASLGFDQIVRATTSTE
ncbi:hypothetical protein RB213_007080 [Colletotrichum asianum]